MALTLMHKHVLEQQSRYAQTFLQKNTSIIDPKQ